MPTVGITVLGPVQAWRDDQELPLGPPQQRSVLALLAVVGGQPITTREIVEALWDSQPPRSAVNVVQTYLKRLRRILEPERPPRSASTLLPARHGGYALRAEPEAVDLWRFRGLLGRARELHRIGDHRRVTTLLADALRQWHGPPGADLPALAQHHRVRAVVEEYGAVVRWYAQASLVTGAPGEAVPVVAQAATGRPFDEPLHAQLIRLYHAAGQRSEAVRVFQSCRRRLHDELGLDPGPELTGAFGELLRDQRPWSRAVPPELKPAPTTVRTGRPPLGRTGP
ncbi:AfsR/SARP family transcriptional regulator [Natronosporangium hydrolyticum]|uniref:AfsR/SARP family transcriptional regulator n=1 Tax=Natronosporangium hydrolyticum TaxID=2811111 RepID=A0A895Y619_9ACTN|nr:AfsR/SARP family transcriptional regulator [Natronosporangium hydrolyticum]QSB13187.1 AfsR/SARP family transcriptional regulator [Natronosporangium hydrolyticum]